MSDETANPGERLVDRLERELGASWTAIRNARATTQEKREKLQEAFEGKISPDTSLVVFGSIARDEMTSSSDLDWILLVDGQALPEHGDQKHTIAAELSRIYFLEPGRSGVFGSLIGSHDIVHEIGGEDDTNSNTTRRVLLLLESLPVGNREAYDRVRRQILNRYLRDDRGLLYGSGNVRIPRFLLNDLTRYWRTVTVDFVYKQRLEAGKKWALRNAKLRMSRKLVFASGLLRCFFCHLDPKAEEARHCLIIEKDASKLLTYMEQQLDLTPLDLLAEAALRPAVSRKTAFTMFESYNSFLAVLDDNDKRQALGDMTHIDMRTSNVWQEIRELSHNFHSSLLRLFFEEDAELRELTTQYGVF